MVRRPARVRRLRARTRPLHRPGPLRRGLGTPPAVQARPEPRTVAALIAGGNIEQLNFHLPFAKQNGVTEEELIETITHLAFYTGWPKAMSAMTVAKNQFQSQANGGD